MTLKTRILVVDDTPLNIKLLKDFLEVEGYGVLSASSGAEALQSVAKENPALILLDVVMPGMGGITAFMHLRRDPLTQHIPVIAVTASARTEDRQKILEAGFNGYQTKPIKVKELPQQVRRVLDGKASPSRDRDTV